MKEIWKDIPGYEGLYQASTRGRIRSLDRIRVVSSSRARTFNALCRGRILRPKILKRSNTSYANLTLRKDGYTAHCCVHRLVAMTFISNPNNLPIINHKDENGLNNRVNNLEWCTYKYNSNYGTAKQKLSEALSVPVIQYDKQGRKIKKHKSIKSASQSTGVSYPCISACCTGRQITAGGFIWRYVGDKFSLSNGKYQVKPVIQCSLSGKVIKEFSSIAEANRQTGIANATICLVCQKRQKTAGGFIWKYKHIKKEKNYDSTKKNSGTHSTTG